jgi:putative endonuclease
MFNHGLRKKGAIDNGVTRDLPQRAWQHREGVIEGFAKE